MNLEIKERRNHKKLHKSENGKIGEGKGLLSESNDEFPKIELDADDHLR